MISILLKNLKYHCDITRKNEFRQKVKKNNIMENSFESFI